MSTSYPGDAQDALYVEDGTPISLWYLSPDIWLGNANPDLAEVGANTIHVRAHMKAGKTFTQSQAVADVYVGNPSLVMTPFAGTKFLGQIFYAKNAFVAPSLNQDKTLTWNLMQGTGDDPEAPGHRCLIARLYPFGTPKPNVFDVPNEQHEAQRNFCVIKCDAQEGKKKAGGVGAGMDGTIAGAALGAVANGLWEFLIDTTALSPKQPEQVTIRATRPATVAPIIRRLALPSLKRLRFRRFAVAPPPRFSIDFDLPEELLPRYEYVGEGDEVKTVELERPWRPEVGEVKEVMVTKVSPLVRLLGRILRAKVPHYDVTVGLEPRRIARFAFKVDLRRTPVGHAQLFRLEQIDAKGRIQGGMALIFVRER